LTELYNQRYALEALTYEFASARSHALPVRGGLDDGELLARVERHARRATGLAVLRECQ